MLIVFTFVVIEVSDVSMARCRRAACSILVALPLDAEAEELEAFI